MRSGQIRAKNDCVMSAVEMYTYTFVWLLKLIRVISHMVLNVKYISDGLQADHFMEMSYASY